MPATAIAQQRSAGAALSAKRGKTATRTLQGAAREMAETMTESMTGAELKFLASASQKGLPDHKAPKDHKAPENHKAPKDHKTPAAPKF